MDFRSDVRAFSQRDQIKYLLAGLVGISLCAAAAAGVRSLLTEKPVAPAPLPPGVLQLTSQQLANLTIAPAQNDDGVLRTGASGQIAVDENRSTPVFLPYSGQVLNVFVQSGQQVRMGDPLLRIRTSDIVDARNSLFSAEAQRANAAAQLAIAQKNAERAEQIYRTAGGALKDYQQAQTDLVNAQTQLRVADSAAAAARDKLVVFGKTPGEIARLSGAGNISGLHAETNLRAPIGGTIVTRNAANGEYLTAGGAQPVFTIADLSTVWLVAAVPESEAARVHLGDRITVTTAALPGRTFDAVIDNVAAQIDPITHRLQVRATIRNTDGALKPQMFADFLIKSDARAATPGPAQVHVSVPAVAVIHEGDSARVWVHLGKGRVMVRPVTTGDSHDGRVVILSGLKPGEQVITSGALFVNEAGLGA